MWTIKIPNWFPPSLNLSRGRHASKSHKKTKECHEYTATYAMMAGVPLVTEVYRPVRLVLIDVTKEGTEPDPDNLLKNLLDGLKAARLIVDDSARWCKWERPTITRVKKGTSGQGTIIVLADAPDAVHTEPEYEAQENDRARELYADLMKTTHESGAIAIADVLWECSKEMARSWRRAEPNRPEFTRAVMEKTVWQLGMFNDPWNFSVFYMVNGEEEVWISYTSAVRHHADRLKAWCEGMGVAVEVRPYNPATAPAPVAVANPDFFG